MCKLLMLKKLLINIQFIGDDIEYIRNIIIMNKESDEFIEQKIVEE